ncbi:hypothetical protein DOY81_000562, partial [Sarcophaga bullata]
FYPLIQTEIEAKKKIQKQQKNKTKQNSDYTTNTISGEFLKKYKI